MKPIREDVYLFDAFPSHVINVYYIGDVLIDAATRYARGRVLRQLEGLTISAHALTHAHPDHQGASHAVCESRNIPFFVGAGDAYAAETGDLSTTMPKGFLSKVVRKMFAGPGHPVAQRLKEGDVVGGFTVIETPGHSPGHVSYFREHDRVLLTGDVVFNMNPFTGKEGLCMPPDLFTVDPAKNRASARKLVELKAETICFGHGPVLTDGAQFTEFLNALPSY